MLMGRQQDVPAGFDHFSCHLLGQSMNRLCPLHCFPFSFGLWLLGWHGNMSFPGLLASFSFSESSAWASLLEERFLLDSALWDASVLSLPNYCLVNWSLYPKGHRLETSHVLRGEREENVFSVRLSKLNHRAHCFQVLVELNPVPLEGA